MLSKQKPHSKLVIPHRVLLSNDKQSPVFYRINIEYFSIYHEVNVDALKQSILTGLTNNFSTINRNAVLWHAEYDQALSELALKMANDIQRQQKQFPVVAIRRLPLDIASLKKRLETTPNDYLCHFHLGWLYSIKQEYLLAERHFNIASLQSQSINPAFACFAYRHLAMVRIKNKRHPQALLAIEAAAGLEQARNPDLQLERIRILTKSNKTTQSLAHLTVLFSKTPYYKSIAFHDAELKDNPTLRRYFQQMKEKQLNVVTQSLSANWKNDPLLLLNLDHELGQENSLKDLQKKQHDLLEKLPALLLFDTEMSSELVQNRSRSIIIRALTQHKQRFIRKIEGHQACAEKVHNTGQWMLYGMIISLIALGLSYAVSTIAYQFDYHWPVNLHIQSIVLGSAVCLLIVGAILLHFTPPKLADLLRRKQRLDELSARLGVSTG